jgi:phosphatidylglycerophosphate synthase
MLLTNQYVVAIVIPLLLLFCGALAKKLVRGGGWKTTDFFLGVELALSALGSAMVYLYDLQKTASSGGQTAVSLPGKMVATSSFLAISFFLLLWILSTHQDWEGRNQNPRGQFLWLGIGGNLVGILLYASFVMLVKGV